MRSRVPPLLRFETLQAPCFGERPNQENQQVPIFGTTSEAAKSRFQGQFRLGGPCKRWLPGPDARFSRPPARPISTSSGQVGHEFTPRAGDFIDFGLAGAALARVCSDSDVRSELGSCPIRENGLAAAQIRALAAQVMNLLARPGPFSDFHGTFIVCVFWISANP